MLRRMGLLALAAALGSGCGEGPTAPGGPTPPQPPSTLAITGTATEPDGSPVTGAWVSAVAGSQGVLQTPDVSGRFAMTLAPVRPGQTVEFHASAPFHVFKVQRSIANGSSMAVAIALERNPDLGLGATIQSALSPDYFGQYVGEAYESDYLFNATGFNFDTSSGATVVELAYSATANARLTMSAVGGAFTSGSTAERQSITLPAGVKDTLLIGQAFESGPLSQDVAFTLTSRPATLEDVGRARR